MGEAEPSGRSPEAKLEALYRLGQALVLLRDEQGIIETVLEIAEQVLDFQDSEFFLIDRSRQELVVVAQRGELHVAAGLRLPLDGEQGVTVAVARSGRPVYVPDVRADPRYVHAGFPAASELAVPVQIEGRVLGVLNVESRELDAYTRADSQLLSVLASHAALALENARLYAQERRRVEELAAVNRAARRVSASLDLRETLDGIVQAAAELVPCVLAEISLWDGERQMLTLQALRCEPQRAFPIGETYPPGRGYTGWVVRHRQPLLVPDVDACQELRPDLLAGEYPFAAYVGLPLLAGDELIGTLVLIHDRAYAFDEEDPRLLEPLAGQAAVAIRNARLYGELARRHRDVAALYAIAEAANHSLDLEDFLRCALERVIEVTHAGGGAIHLLDPQTHEVMLAAHQGLSETGIRGAGRDTPRGCPSQTPSQENSGWIVCAGESSLCGDTWADPCVSPELREWLRDAGYRSLAQVPLRAQARVVGTLGVVAGDTDLFDEDDLKLLDAIGHQIGVAVENARLQQQALEAERLAAVGRMASTVAHDLRSPLGGIIRSAEFLARPELSDATRQKLSRAIVAMARRLVDTTQELLDYARGDQVALHPTPCGLSWFLEQVIEVLMVDFSDRGIEVTFEWGYTGEVWMDTDRMAQVVYNIAANARDAMPEGGRLTVVTRRVGEWVELRFTDTGPGIPPELAERIFEPFVSYGKREGVGLGLAIAHRIIQEHGGEIEVESPAEGGATFVVRLPLRR